MSDTKMPVISVILPVYNVEPYIGACIESLKQQSFRDLEFIFVDDCSTDNSVDVIEDFARTDPRVRIIRNTENLGPGPTRNRGIEAAKGAYLSFIDPDDRIAPDFYERLYAKAVSGNYDIAKGIRRKVDLESGDSYIENLNPEIRKDIKRGIPFFVLFSWQHQTAIYKKNLFEDKKVRYGNSRNAQDVTFLLTVCKKARNIVFDDDAVYYYVQRSGSQTASFTEQLCRYELDSLSERIDFLLSGNMDVFDYLYLSKRFLKFASLLFHVISINSLSEEREKEYVNAFRQQILRIPDQEQIKTFKGELMILMDYQKLIPAHNLRPNEFHYDRVRRWADFLSEHPKIKEKSIMTEFDIALVEVIFPYNKISGKYVFSGKQYFAFIREQIGRLTGRQRSLMFRYSSPAMIYALKIIYRIIRPKEN